MAEQKAKSSLNATQLILIIGIALALIVIAGVGYLIITKKTDVPQAPIAEIKGAGTAVVITEENKDVKQPPPGMFTTNMNAIWTFPTGNAPSNDAMVGNDKSNTSPFYFEVILADTQQLVYTSPKIPVGSEIKELILDVPLEKGTYDALCAYNLLNEDGTTYSTLSFGVVLSIQA